MIKLIALFFLPAVLFSSQLNNLTTGSFVDIGKTSGFTEVETPMTTVLEKPNYSLVDNIINKSNRVLDIDGCFVDGSNIESCLKHENICSTIYNYGKDKITKHTGNVVDYSKYKFADDSDKTVYWAYLESDTSASKSVVGVDGVFYFSTHYCGKDNVKDSTFQKCASNHGGAAVGCGSAVTPPLMIKNNDGIWCKRVDYDNYLEWCGGGGNDGSWGKYECSSAYDSDGNIKKICEKHYKLDNHDRCYKNISYNYYTYGCKSSRFTPINKGLSSCGRLDTDKNSVNKTELAKNCNEALPQKNNCQEILHRCPVSNSIKCAYKGNNINIFLPLKHFNYETPSFFKEWEYGNTRGYDCTTYAKQALYNSYDQNLTADYELDGTGWNGTTNEVRDSIGMHNGIAINGAKTVTILDPFKNIARVAFFGDSVNPNKHQYIKINNFPKIKGSRTITAWIKPKSHGRIFADDFNNRHGDYALSYGDYADMVKNPVPANQTYLFPIKLSRVHHVNNFIWHASKTFYVSDLNKITSATVTGGADDAVEIIVNGHVVYAQDKTQKKCTVPFYVGSNNKVYCGEHNSTEILSEAYGNTNFNNKDFKKYLKAGNNTITTYYEVTGGGSGESTYKIVTSGVDIIKKMQITEGEKNKIRFFIRGLNPGSLDSGTSLESNKWYFIAATFDSTNMKKYLYVFNANGSMLSQKSQQVYGTLSDSEGKATIGGEDELGSEGNMNGFHGYISSLHISDNYFSLEDIKNTIKISKNKQLLASYDCQFGIKEISANNPGEICFKDMHNYQTCISYLDNSSCHIHGVIRSGNSFPIKGLKISSDRKILLPTNIIGASGRISTDCLFHGKVGYDDVGLGIISVKANKNRLTFWNSYNSGMIGFLDVVPKINSSLNEDSSLVKFNFENFSNGFFDDESLNGNSKDFISNVKTNNISVDNGITGNALFLSKDRNTTISIKGGSDLDFNGLSNFSISLFVKLLSSPKSDSYILYNKNQIAIKLSKNLKISALVSLSDGTVKSLTSDTPLNLNNWTLVTFSLSPKDISLFVNNNEKSIKNNGLKINGSNDRTIVLGENRDTTGKLDLLIDKILISNGSKNLMMQKILLETKPKLYSYLNSVNDEVKSLMANAGFDVLYKSNNGHIYMVSKDKISADTCYKKIKNTTFSLAIADANLSNFPKKNLERINQAIALNCNDEALSACDENITSNECIDANFSNSTDSNITYLKNLVSEIHAACKEKILLRGLSKESMDYGYGYGNDSKVQHCIIESSDTKPVSFQGIEFIRRNIDNSKNAGNYVCSDLSCNKNHYCGVATCQNGTEGTIGVPSGYIGCVDQSCDISKNYYEKCGDMSGCPHERDIISNIIETVSANKNIKVETNGYDIVSERNKHAVYINGKKIMNLSRSWNTITFDDNYNVLEKKTFDIYGNESNADRFKNYLNSIPKNRMTIVITYDEPSRHVIDNTNLLNTMENFGMNRYTLEHLAYRSAYLFVGRKGDTPKIEEYIPNFEDGLEKTFSFIKSNKQTKCYKVTCPSGSTLNKDTMQCEKIGCDDRSILKDGKCISKIAN